MVAIEVERVEALITYTASDPPGYRSSLVMPLDEWTGKLTREQRSEIQRRLDDSKAPPVPVEINITFNADDVIAAAQAAVNAAQAAIDQLSESQPEVAVVDEPVDHRPPFVQHVAVAVDPGT